MKECIIGGFAALVITANVISAAYGFATYAINKQEKHLIRGAVFLSMAIVCACVITSLLISANNF